MCRQYSPITSLRFAHECLLYTYMRRMRLHADAIREWSGVCTGLSLKYFFGLHGHARGCAAIRALVVGGVEALSRLCRGLSRMAA